MKCSRCGEECKVGQTFCLKCGTPIQIEPDINEFESEIADNVGKLLKDDKSDKTLEDLQLKYLFSRLRGARYYK